MLTHLVPGGKFVVDALHGSSLTAEQEVVDMRYQLEVEISVHIHTWITGGHPEPLRHQRRFQLFLPDLRRVSCPIHRPHEAADALGIGAHGVFTRESYKDKPAGTAV